MNNKPVETPVYPVGAASLFASHARMTSITAWCDTCGSEREMPLVYETERDEVYVCTVCGAEHRYTVR